MNLHFQLQDLENELVILFNAYPELMDDDQLRADMVEGSTSLHDVMLNLYRSMQNDEERIQALKLRLAHLSSRQDALNRRVSARRGLMMRLLQRCGLRKIELPDATLTVRAVRPAVVVTDPELLPAEFLRTKVEPDKSLIRAALEAHGIVPGATLGNGGETLAIRI